MKTFFAATLALSMLAAPAIAAPRDNQGGGQGQGQHQGNQGNQGQNNGNGQHQGQGQNNGNGNGQHQGQGQNNGNGNGQGNGQAQNHGNGQGNGNGHAQNQNNGGNHWTQNNGGRDHDARPQAQRQYSYNGRNYNAVRGPVWNAPRGYDARRVWNRGDRLPEGYRHRAYVVDYRAYHLARPSYGYQWVRVGNSVYLVRASNGVVAQIVWNLFY